MEAIGSQELAKMIQHTNVNPDLKKEEVYQLFEDCLTYQFDGVMIQPCWITDAKLALKGTDIKICTALGYPMGGATTEAKVYETSNVFSLGADQLDFMANVGFLKSGMFNEYQDEVRQIVKAAQGKTTKIMLEFGMLKEEEKKIAAELAIEAGVTYVKNSSGWGKGGKATIEDMRLLKQIAGDRVLVKASGGIRNRSQALAMIEAGATLLGTSAGASILSDSEPELETDY